MKTKILACAAALVALCSMNLFATPPLGSGFTYQGRLNDSGAPANGNYDMIFNLYDAPTNGNVLGTFSIFGAVPVTNGLFTLELNANGEFGPSPFSGQPRWLQIGVRTNSNNAANPWIYLSPRQPLDPTPYASYAVNAGNSFNSLYASNATFASTASLASNASAVAWANITGIPAGFADGIDNDTTYAAGPGLNLNWANQFSVNFGGNGTATTAAHSDHGHFGAVWGGNQSLGLGLIVTNGASNGAGLYGQQGSGSGFPYVFGNTAGVWGESSQGSGVFGGSASFRGVQGMSMGAQGSGVYGTALSSTGTNYGVYGKSASTNGGAGVCGLAGTASANSTKTFLLYPNVGVVGDSATGNGVVGFSDDGGGVVGSSVNNLGVYGESWNDTAVQGYSVSGTGIGVEGVNYNGVALKATGTGIIQSDAESVLWFPATFPRNDVGISTPHVFANAVSADITVSQTGIVSWPMSLNLPGTLYGQNVTVKSVTIYYKCSAGARSYPGSATLYYTNPDGTFSFDIIDAPASGNNPLSMGATVNRQLSANGGFVSLLLSANFGSTADKISYYGVKVVLGHK